MISASGLFQGIGPRFGEPPSRSLGDEFDVDAVLAGLIFVPLRDEDPGVEQNPLIEEGEIWVCYVTSADGGYSACSSWLRQWQWPFPRRPEQDPSRVQALKPYVRTSARLRPCFRL